MAVDEARLNELLNVMVGDVGAAMHAGNVVVGHRLGLYRALAEKPATAAELAERTGCHPRYITEWLRGQAAGGYVTVDLATETYSLTEEQEFTLTDPDGPVYLPGAFLLALGALRAEPRVTQVFRDGTGIGWHEHDDDVFDGCEQFFRPGYVGNLLTSWLPALDGVVDRLHAGARVADVGCGHGASTVLMAREFPRSAFVGSDYHAESIDQAAARAEEAGVGDRARFEVATAQNFGGGPYDLVTTFDCLHDMGDPRLAASHIRDSLAPGGTWMIVEPSAGETLADNLNPVSRSYYSFSTFLCVPNALSQHGGYSLGAQAGPRPIEQLARDAGFRSFRLVAQTPFNMVYEARV
jgi:2-polyprenyl-3-methyl-5-hydroxy-6-metoxy-1,4-benzoquinol methylase